MTDREAKSVEARIKKCISTWVPIFGLSNWELSVTFDQDRDIQDRDCAGRAWVEPEYMEAGLTFYIPAILAAEDRLEYTVVHELAHVLVDEAAGGAHGFHVERSTTMVAQSLLRARGETK